MQLPRIYLADMTIGRSILIIAALPLVLSLVLATVLTLNLSRKANDLKELDTLVTAVSVLSDLVHEQQKERGATAVFLSSEGRKFRQQLNEQRRVTDARRAELKAFLAQFDRSVFTQELDQRLNDITDGLARMDAIRRQVDALKISPGDAIGYYTGLNGEMLGMIGYVSKLSKTAEVTVATLALNNFLQAKERAGIERAVGSSGFGNGQFDAAALNRFRTLIDEQRVYYSGFLAGATPDQAAGLEAVMKSPAAREVQSMRDIALKAGIGGELSGRTAAEFFDAQTQKINQLKALEQRLIGDLRAFMTKLRSQARTAEYSIISGLALAIALTAAIAYFFSHMIRKGIFGVVDAAATMARGNLERKLPNPTRNELGAIVRALELFRKTILRNKEMEQRMRQREIAEAERKAEEERKQAEIKAAQQTQRQRELDAKRAREQKAAAELASVVDACAKGDFSQRLTLEGKDGIFADLAKSVNQIGEVTNTGISNVQAALETLSKGDLTHRMSGEYFGAFDDIRNAFNQTLESLSKMIRQIETGSQAIGGISDEIASSASDLATRTERNAATLEQTSAAIEQLAASVSATAGSAKDVSSAVSGIQAKTQHGNDVVKSAIEAVQQIKSSSNSISKIISVIEEIAFQTNLLALNAGVEAARAGEAGHGFAVVASEVRSLASRSAEAAKEISDLISDSSKRVDEGVALVDQTGSVLESIFEAVNEISSRVEEIAVSAREQSTSIAEINTATAQLDQSTQVNATMFEQATATSYALKSEIEALNRVISAFKVEEYPDSSVPSFVNPPPEKPLTQSQA